MPSTPDVLAIIPMKPLAEAKSRLWPDVPPDLRHAAVLLMLDRVARAAIDALGAGGCRVIGGDTLVRRVVEDTGCHWGPERGHDLNSSLWLAMQSAYAEGWKATLFLPADLPQAAAKDIQTIIEVSESLSRPVGVAAERDGGTNALLLPAAIAFAPLLGRDSFAKHIDAARRQGTQLVEVKAASLGVDVDTPADLAWARVHVAGFEAELTRWKEWLVVESMKDRV